MHIIEQVSSIHFPSDGANHKLLKVTNKTSIIAARALKKKADEAKSKGKGALTSHPRRGGSSPPVVSRSTSSEPLTSSSSGKSKKPSKFKFLMNYMFGQCYASAQRKHDMQERLYRMEQWAGIVSSSLLAYVPPRDPMEPYDEACRAYADEGSSCHHGKTTAAPEDDEYREEDDDDDDDDNNDDGGDDEDYDIE
jgi:hypothetical protein